VVRFALVLALAACGDKRDSADQLVDTGEGPEADSGSDGGTDDCIDPVDWYADTDGDSYGDPLVTISSCDPGPGWSENALDCDDTDADTSPAASETCDGEDDDCDEAIDEDLPVSTWYTDADGDGIGVDDGTATDACAQPDGTVASAGDCDDTDDTSYPGAPEACDGTDHDCDGLSNDGVRFIDGDGTASSVTHLFNGTSVAPATVPWEDDGTLTFCADTWYVNLSFSGTSLVVEGEGSDTTVLDGVFEDTVIEIAASGATLSVAGLTITRGIHGIAGSSTRVDGIDLTVTDSVVTGNDSGDQFAGGISIVGELSLVDSAITDNASCFVDYDGFYCWGGGVFVTGSVQAVGSEISGNTIAGAAYGYLYDAGGAYGGGIYATEDVSLEDTVVEDNSLVLLTSGAYLNLQGGGVWAGGSVELSGSSVSRNTAEGDLSCSAYDSCETGSGGGGVYADGSVSLVESAVDENDVHVVKDACQVAGGSCSAYSYGGGVRARSGLALDASSISGNSLDLDVEADFIFIAGGGAYVVGAVTCSGSSKGGEGFTSNVAELGGGLYWSGSGATVEAIDCDWGSSKTGDDNDSGDIRGSADGDFDGVASFTCAPGGGCK
jgi:Putative metal-binding motif